MSHSDAETTLDEPTEGQSIDRRRALKAVGGAVVGSAILPAVARAHIDEGKEISWVAFCGCDGGLNVRYTRCDEEGELGAVAYDCDGGTVYYKAGRDIYRHEYTRRNEDSDPDNDIDWHVIEVDYAGTEDPIASTNPSDSRDPCGILAGTGGTKLEKGEILEEADVNNCGSGTESEGEDRSGRPASAGPQRR